MDCTSTFDLKSIRQRPVRFTPIHSKLKPDRPPSPGVSATAAVVDRQVYRVEQLCCTAAHRADIILHLTGSWTGCTPVSSAAQLCQDCTGASQYADAGTCSISCGL